VVSRRARLYDALALLTVGIVIAIDQWTKALVVEYLSPPDTKPYIHLLGPYLVIRYIQNRGAAFGLFANTLFLAVLIVVAISVIAYLYLRMLNSGPLGYKIIFGMIIGGALGNLIDRIHHGGYVVDFIFFQIPQIGYQFAIFNLADASISVGVFLLFAMLIFGSLRHREQENDAPKDAQTVSSSQRGAIRSTEQDAQP
jgi:signal peptidase II